MSEMREMKSLTMPNGITYEIVDDKARQALESLIENPPTGGSGDIAIVEQEIWNDITGTKQTTTLKLPNGTYLTITDGKDGINGADGCGIYLWDPSNGKLSIDDEGNQLYAYNSVTKPSGDFLVNGDLLIDYAGSVYKVECLGTMAFRAFLQFSLKPVIDGSASSGSAGGSVGSGSSGNVDLTGYATEEWVGENYQPKGEYLTSVPSGYAKTEDIPTKTSELINDSTYATETFVQDKISEAQLSGGDGSASIEIVTQETWEDITGTKHTTTLKLPGDRYITITDGKDGINGVNGCGMYLWDPSTGKLSVDDEGNQLYSYTSVIKPNGDYLVNGDLLIDNVGNVYMVECLGTMAFKVFLQFSLKSSSGDGSVTVTTPYRRNLLINSDFTNPVNQNGATDYTSGYGLDRWVATGKNSRWSIVNGGLEVCTADAASQPYIDQRIPEKTVSYTADAEKKYTVAAKIDGSIYVTIETVGGASGGVNTPFGTMAFLYSLSAACMVVRFNLLKTEKHVIEWAALYEGEYTIDTLPEYQPNGYENELLVCRQYDPVTGEYIGLRKFGQPHNLLINSDFRNPVNQSGKDSYELSASWGSTINNWYGTYAIVSVHDGFVKFTAEKIAQYKRLGQYVSTPIEVGKTYTLALCAKANDIGGYFTLRPMDQLAGISGADGYNVYPESADYEVYTYSFTLATKPTNLGIEILMQKSEETFADIDIKWFALYEGAYTVDTLPDYQSKDHIVEELACGVLTTHTTATLSASSWSTSAPYTLTLSVSGILASDYPHVAPVYSDTLATAKTQQEAWRKVCRAKAAANSIIFYCYEEKPTTNIPIQIEVNR